MHKVNNKFTKSSYFITELKLCAVRLVNNKKFPWIILIPKRIKVTDITELKSNDQILLIKEIVLASKIMKKVFNTKKLNIEKIGNKTSQLHIHIIARSRKDSSWPLSVWVVRGKTYSKSALIQVTRGIRKAFK